MKKIMSDQTDESKSNRNLPKIRKPSRDGKPLTPDEIEAIRGEPLNAAVAWCLCGWRSSETLDAATRNASGLELAWSVDRPEWRWRVEDGGRDGVYACVTGRRRGASPRCLWRPRLESEREIQRSVR